MSSMQDKELVRRYIEDVFEKGNYAAADQYVTPNIVVHNPTVGEPQGVEGVRQFAQVLRTAFADLHTTFDVMVAEGDLVGTHMTVTGTHRGEFMGVSPTGKHVTWNADAFFRIANGKIVERWGSHNLLGLLQQIGASIQVPAPAGR